MKLIFLAVVVLLVVVLNGCNNGPVLQTIVKAHPIDYPKPPKNFAVKEPGLPLTDDKEWIEVQNLQPKQYWRAYSDGAIVLRPSDWKVVISTRNNTEKWKDLMVKRLDEHNAIINQVSPDIIKLPEKKPWYKFW
jgi:hypothetical protein